MGVGSTSTPTNKPYRLLPDLDQQLETHSKIDEVRVAIDFEVKETESLVTVVCIIQVVLQALIHRPL